MFFLHLQDPEEYEELTRSHPTRALELVCQRDCDQQPDTSSQDDFDRTTAAQSYPNLAPTFISRNRQQATIRVFKTSANPDNLAGTQLEVYTSVQQHFTAPHHCDSSLQAMLERASPTSFNA